MSTDAFPMIRPVPYMGVIWVVHEAAKLGFWNGNPEWCNLGQGQPEVGEIVGAPPRIKEIRLTESDQAYGPLGGSREVREAIAETYNRTYRKGMKSQYTADNVSFAAGGRLALTRLFAALADGTRILYKSPDYTAYEDYLAYHKSRCVMVPLVAEEADGFSIPADRLEASIRHQKIGAFVFSNPCNPTGEVIAGDELARYVDMAGKYNCLLGCDEFYSHFIYNQDGSPGPGPVSAAAYVEDVEKAPVLLVDGLTKSHRYPGWRAGWVVGPSYCVEMINRAASALDGGPSLMVQRAALEALEPSRVERETTALRKVFAEKRALMLRKLLSLGITPAANPAGTFYIWANIRGLPAPLNDGDAFFHACLARKVMTVPGRFFDIHPDGVRPVVEPFGSWVRFSYGPSLEVVTEGLSRIERLVTEARAKA